jgi:hypothetical protein
MTAKIVENGQHFIEQPTPRYCEFGVENMQGEIDLDGTLIHLERLRFGCGVKFDLKRADVNNLVVGDHMLSRFTVGTIPEREFRVSIITDRERGIVSIEIHDRTKHTRGGITRHCDFFADATAEEEERTASRWRAKGQCIFWKIDYYDRASFGTGHHATVLPRRRPEAANRMER